MRRLGLALLLFLAAAEGRRHRYGYAYNSYQDSRRAVNDRQPRESTLDDLEDDVIDAVSRTDDKDWPPRWTKPVVACSVIWYGTLFFT